MRSQVILLAAILPLASACAGTAGGRDPDIERAKEMRAEGDQAYQQRDYERAIERYSEAIRLNPDYAEAYLRRGQAYSWVAELPDPEINTKETRLQALNDYSIALQKNPALYDAALNRGVMLVVMKQFHEAVKAFLLCAELRPDAAEPHQYIGELYDTRFEGMGLRAIDHYEKYVLRGGDNPAIIEKVRQWQALKQQTAPPPSTSKAPTPEEEETARALHDRMTKLVGEGKTLEAIVILDELLTKFAHTKYVRDRSGPFNAMRRAMQPQEKK
jgi:tetratricopeptide (TPR) repeat protein